MKKDSMNNLKYIFCIWCLLALFLSVIMLFLSHGQYWSGMFFRDTLDTGMDFFHSIEYTKGRTPYELFDTLYPPLANLFFYFVYRFVPTFQSDLWTNDFFDSINARGTKIDLRVNQATLLLFVFFVIGAVLLSIYVIKKYLGESKEATAVAVLCVFTHGFLYGIERGNIILLAFICSAVFVLFEDSNNKIMAEIALIFLAIGAGLKIYPAIFGMVLLYNRQYGRALRACIYGVLCCVLPCFCFKEGLGCITGFLKALFMFTNQNKLDGIGFSFDKIMSSFGIVFCDLFDINASDFFFLQVAPIFNYVVVIVLLIEGFLLKEKWKKALCCSMAVILVQNQGPYILVFLLIPLIMLMKQGYIEVRDGRYFVLLLWTQLLLPIVNINNDEFSVYYFRFQLPILILFFFLIYDVVMERRINIRKNNTSSPEILTARLLWKQMVLYSTALIVVMLAYYGIRN